MRDKGVVVSMPKMRGNGDGNATSSLTSAQFRDSSGPSERAAALRECRLQKIIEMLLDELGLDVDSERFRETPKRVARFYREFTRGYYAKPAEILKVFASRNRELVVVSNIRFYSLCPHHLLIYGGKVHVGYVPDGRIAGISKIPRMIDTLAARAVMPEELVADIADTFVEVVKPLGCAVELIGKHDCVAAHGMQRTEPTITTLALRGVFSDDQKYVQQFYQGILSNEDWVC